MTPEKTIETAYQIALAHDPESYKFFREHWREFINAEAFPVFASCAALIRDAMETMDKKAGAGGKLSAGKRLIKECTRENMRGYWLDNAGRYCLCNGYSAARLAEPLHGLPEVATWDGLPKVFQELAKNTRRVDLPSVAELKQIIAAGKANRDKRPRYDFGEGLPAVNAQFLLDMLALLPGAVVTVADTRTEIAPLYFRTDDGSDGILMPVKK